MNKSSRLFWLLVLAQACTVAGVLGWLLVREPVLLSSAGARDVRIDFGGGLRSTLNMFSNDCGRYPTTTEGFRALITCPAIISQKFWKGPYFDPPTIPLDPWGREYVYRYPGTHNTNSFDLYSTGADGISKSSGDDPDDINNWDPGSPRGEDLSTGDPFFKIACALLFIPFTCGVCSITAKFSPKVHEFIGRNRSAQIVWLATSVIAIMLFLSNFAPDLVHR